MTTSRHYRRPDGHPLRLAATAAVLSALTLCLPTAPAAAASRGPSNGRIVFGAETSTGSQLWTIEPDGSDLQQVTHVDGDASSGDWSPNGRSLTFELGTPEGVSVAVMDADGQHLRVLPNLGAFEGQPVFTEQGRRVLYERYDGGTDDALFTQRVTGGDEQRVTPRGPDGYSDPNVSPNGRHLSYIRYDNGVEYQQALTVADADGSHPRDLLPPSADIALKHAWSPDSHRLVFTRDANPDPVTGVLSANIGTIAADGTGLEMLTHYTGGHLSAFAGSYSPDGRWIVFRLQDNDSGRSGLWIMHPDGTAGHEIFHRDGVRARGSDWG